MLQTLDWSMKSIWARRLKQIFTLQILMKEICFTVENVSAKTIFGLKIILEHHFLKVPKGVLCSKKMSRTYYVTSIANGPCSLDEASRSHLAPPSKHFIKSWPNGNICLRTIWKFIFTALKTCFAWTLLQRFLMFSPKILVLQVPVQALKK